MKKHLSHILASLCLLSAAMMPLEAHAIEYCNRTCSPEAITIKGEHFSYSTLTGTYMQDKFLLESDLLNADFMIVGIEYNGDEIYGYWVTPINQIMGGLGTISQEDVNAFLNIEQLQVGDLLRSEEDIAWHDIYPTQYLLYHNRKPTTEYIGYGPELLGDGFRQVIRQQLLLKNIENPVLSDEIAASHTAYGIPLVTGDADASGEVDILDCITMTKFLHGRIAYGDYAKYVSDINLDGEIDVFDLDLLKNMLLG